MVWPPFFYFIRAPQQSLEVAYGTSINIMTGGQAEVLIDMGGVCGAAISHVHSLPGPDWVILS